ncbi:MAG TPA: VTT domain-containing protein [Candidatus Methylacidiphilales bacterium]|jgi:membrane-associated protein|nr:VTT domain-containing protein [Candidatus Methylacidiphilales bacterium]
MHSIIDFIKNLYDPVYMQGLIHAGGVPLIAAIVFAETGLLVGFFLPGDTMLFVAGVMAATKGLAGDDTLLNIWALVPALIAAAIIGDQLGYFLGFKTGHAIFTREEGFFFKRKHAEKAHAFYLKYGVWAVVLAKFAPVLRTFVPFMAGVGEMPYRKYISVDTFAVIAWICLVVLSGYILGERAQKNLHYIVFGIALVSMLPVIIGVMKEFLASRKKAA